MAEKGHPPSGAARGPGGRNVLEWAILAASLFAIVAVVGVLVVDGLSGPRPADPVVELRVEEAREGSAGWILPATLLNGGSDAAEKVVLEATATVAGTEESSEVEVDFLPGGTTVDVAFGFTAEPDAEVMVRVVSFVEP